MTKFKVGDRVRYLGTSTSWSSGISVPKGYEFVVGKLSQVAGYAYVYVSQADPSVGLSVDSNVEDRHLELVSAAPTLGASPVQQVLNTCHNCNSGINSLTHASCCLPVLTLRKSHIPSPWTSTVPSFTLGMDMGTPPPNTEPVCECGAEKAGVGGHSPWCGKFVAFGSVG